MNILRLYMEYKNFQSISHIFDYNLDHFKKYLNLILDQHFFNTNS